MTIKKHDETGYAVAKLLDLLVLLRIQSAKGNHVYMWDPTALNGHGSEFVKFVGTV